MLLGSTRKCTPDRHKLAKLVCTSSVYTSVLYFFAMLWKPQNAFRIVSAHMLEVSYLHFYYSHAAHNRYTI